MRASSSWRTPSRAWACSPATGLATLAWNTHRHLELYYGISGIGAVLHTINPRLFPEQIRYIVNHADDQWVFVDLNLRAGRSRSWLPQTEG
jgi:acyl-CoA synthetase (AMP-forming)/AMP-acid ligase II